MDRLELRLYDPVIGKEEWALDLKHLKRLCARVLVNGEDILEIVTPEKKLGHQDVGSLYFDLSEPFERDGRWHKWEGIWGPAFYAER